MGRSVREKNPHYTSRMTAGSTSSRRLEVALADRPTGRALYATCVDERHVATLDDVVVQVVFALGPARAEGVDKERVLAEDADAPRRKRPNPGRGCRSEKPRLALE
jgi:hypothetical protein